MKKTASYLLPLSLFLGGMFFSPAGASGEMALAIYDSVQSETKVHEVKKVGVDADGDLTLVLEGGNIIQVDETKTVEMFRMESDETAFHMFYPRQELLKTVAPIGSAILGTVDNFSGYECSYGLDQLPDWGGLPAGTDCSSGSGFDWTAVQDRDMTAVSKDGKSYPFTFKFALGERKSDQVFTPAPENNLMLYIENMNTPGELGGQLNSFWVRLNMYDRVYVDVKNLSPGDAAFIPLHTAAFDTSGLTIDELAQGIKAEFNGYDDADWAYGDLDKIIASASELTPVADFHPKSGNLDTDSYPVRLSLCYPGLAGTSNLDFSAFKFEYNDWDATQPLLDGVISGSFSLSAYTNDPGKTFEKAGVSVNIPEGKWPKGSNEYVITLTASAGVSGTVSVTQVTTVIAPDPACTYTVSPSSLTLKNDEQFITIDVKTGSNCQWVLETFSDWLHIQKPHCNGYKGTGSESMKMLVSQNGICSVSTLQSTYDRKAIISVAGKDIQVTQQGCQGPHPGHGKPGDTFSMGVGYGQTLEFVWVEGGSYEMGCGDWMASPVSNPGGCVKDEFPVHQEYVTGFWMGKYEVTQGQWAALSVGSDKVFHFPISDNHPADRITAKDAYAVFSNLNLRYGSGQGNFRLPTEAEWEYAARSGGKQEVYPGGYDQDTVAWHGQNSGSVTHEVGEKAPNGLGLYDMSGNVAEWCSDAYGSAYLTDPKGSPFQVYRGGQYYGGSGRTTERAYEKRDAIRDHIGFRIVLEPPYSPF